MTLRQSAPANSWLESTASDATSAGVIDMTRSNGWSESNLIGRETEDYLVSVGPSLGGRDLRFLGSHAAQLPGSDQNNWREWGRRPA